MKGVTYEACAVILDQQNKKKRKEKLAMLMPLPLKLTRRNTKERGGRKHISVQSLTINPNRPMWSLSCSIQTLQNCFICLHNRYWKPCPKQKLLHSTLLDKQRAHSKFTCHIKRSHKWPCVHPINCQPMFKLQSRNSFSSCDHQLHNWGTTQSAINFRSKVIYFMSYNV